MEAASSSSDGSVPPRDSRWLKLEATGILVSPKLTQCTAVGPFVEPTGQIVVGTELLWLGY